MIVAKNLLMNHTCRNCMYYWQRGESTPFKNLSEKTWCIRHFPHSRLIPKECTCTKWSKKAND